MLAPKIHRWTAVFALILTTIGAAQSVRKVSNEWKELQGERVPEISAKDWFNVKGSFPSRANLRGKVWLVHFFDTSSDGGMDKLEELSKLHAKYFAKGLRVISITDDTKKRVQKRVISKTKPKHWIGSDPGFRTMRRFTEEGWVSSGMYPKFYLVDTKGKVVAEELPSEKTIEAQLKQVVLLDLPEKIHPKLKSARLAFSRRAFGAAWKSANRQAGSKDEKLAADAKMVRARVEEYASFRKSALKGELIEGDPEEIYGEALTIKYEFGGMRDITKWASALVKKQAKRSEVKRYTEGWGRFEKALQTEIRGYNSKFKRNKAKEAYDSLGVDNPRQVFGKLAKARSKRL